MTRHPTPPLFDALNPKPQPLSVAALREALQPVDPNVREQDRPRLSAQCERLLAWLQSGERVTPSAAFAAGIQRLAARVHDLRKHGYDVKADYCESNGTAVYWMEATP